MKVLVAGGGTGGHVMPALAIADALRERRPDLEPVIVGAERGVEASLLPARQLAHPYYLLPVDPIYRRQWWKNIRWLGGLGRLMRECARILDEERPAVAVGTGGYASGPILFLAARRGIPIALQEQNAQPGLTTRLLARWASEVYLGFAEAETRLKTRPRTRVFVLGNPVAPPANDPDSRRGAREALGIAVDAEVCFVMGGSQGARAINAAVAAAVDGGALDDVVLLWSTGATTWPRYREYHVPPSRIVRPFWDPVSTAYQAADLVVARAGAMTTAELCVWGRPSILIPLPSAAADHQTTNAEALAAAGSTVHLPESALRDHVLARHIREILGSPVARTNMERAARERGYPNAATAIADRIAALVGVKQSIS